MTDPMAALDAAYARVQQAEKLAEEIVNGAWLEFGRAIRDARAQGTKQADIARHFDREPEHIRRLQEDADVVDGLKPPPARKTRQAPNPASAAALRRLFVVLTQAGADDIADFFTIGEQAIEARARRDSTS